MTKWELVLVLSMMTMGFVDARQYIIEFDLSKRENQQTAENLCKSQFGTSLATITSLEDQLKIEDLAGLVNITQLNGENLDIYIGLNDIQEERLTNKLGWKYTSGIEQTVEFFARGDGSNDEPNNFGAAGEDCVTLSNKGKTPPPGVTIPWFDVSCDKKNLFVCDDAVKPRFIFPNVAALNFTNAQKFCQDNFQSNLGTVRNQKEQDYLRRLVGKRPVWIGLNDIANEGTFVYVSGIQSTFTNFDVGQPNGSDDCVAVLNQDGGVWNDIGCFLERRFVCDGDFEALNLNGDVDNNNDNDDDGNAGNDNTLLIGIGAGVGAAVLVASAVFYMRRNRSSNNSSSSFVSSQQQQHHQQQNLGYYQPQTDQTTYHQNFKSTEGYGMNNHSPISQEFDRVEAIGRGDTTGLSSRFGTYLAQLNPSHYFHQSGNTSRQNLGTFRKFRKTATPFSSNNGYVQEPRVLIAPKHGV